MEITETFLIKTKYDQMGNSNVMLTGNTLNFNLRLFLEPRNWYKS